MSEQCTQSENLSPTQNQMAQPTESTESSQSVQPINEDLDAMIEPKLFENPPPVRNYPVYWWRVLVKLFSFFIFGLGSALISVIAFPVMKLLFPHPKKFRTAGHRFISYMFRFFICVMTVIGCSYLTTPDKKKFRQLKSKVIVANHPSILDVVMLISLIPNADCIVNAYLSGRNILHLIVCQLYIPTSLSHEEIMQRCAESLREGNCIIIFPEGTRSLPGGQHPYKKGAARIALMSGCPIVPVYMGGNDKRGLRKHDPWLTYNTRNMWHYAAYMKDEIFPEPYKNLPEPAAAKRMTQAIHEVLCDEANMDYIELY